MKRFYWIVVGVSVAVVLTVLFVPGVAEYVQGEVLSWLVRLSG